MKFDIKKMFLLIIESGRKKTTEAREQLNQENIRTLGTKKNYQ